MLADPRSEALITNFAEQWLHLRNLKNSGPDLQAFPDFDDNLRQAMKEETTLFFDSIMREDRSVVDLLNADYTFVNERLARHYGIPNVYGSQFRRVTVASEARRGLLGQASMLTVTSYPNRTSPVERGKWVLTNLLGVPPQPPPPNVPPLQETASDGKVLSLRERMEKHRANPVCAGCHKAMDPIGFALENFDGIGRWRTSEDGAADRYVGHAVQRRRRGRRRRAPPESRRPAGDLRRRHDGEDADLRAGARARVLRHAGRAEDRAGREEPTIFASRRSCWASPGARRFR